MTKDNLYALLWVTGMMFLSLGVPLILSYLGFC